MTTLAFDPLKFVPGVNPEDLDGRFLNTLRWYASQILAHRYAARYGIYVLVTSGYRPDDAKAHGSRGGADIRGHWMPTDEKEKRKLEMWLSALWGEACARIGYAVGQWGFGAYDDDRHYHVDVRLHVGPELYAATWVGR